MADNIILNSGSGGATLRTDDDGTAHWQYVKLAWGADNTQTILSDSDPLPIDDAGGSLTVDNAGTFAVQVDGAALTALQLIDNPVVVDDAAFTPATTSVMMAGATFDDTTPDTVNEGDAGAIRMSTRRELYVQLRDAAGNERGLNVDASGDIGVTNAGLTELAAAINASQVDVNLAASAATVTVTDDGSFTLAANSGVDIGDVDILSVTPGTGTNNLGKAVDAVAGATDAGVAVLAVRDDALGGLTPIEGDYARLHVDANGALWTRDDVIEAAISGNEMQVDVVAALPAGDNNIGNVDIVTSSGQAAEATALPGVFNVIAGDDGTDTHPIQVDASGNLKAILQSNTGVDIGDVDILSLPNEGQQTMANSISVAVASDQSDLDVALQGKTTGGNSFFKSIDVDETEEEIKATAGQIYGYYIHNNAAAVRYVKFYNATAATVVVGTTVPDLTLPIPANQAANASFPTGIAFGTAITVAATTGVADNDSGAPAANDVQVNVFYT